MRRILLLLLLAPVCLAAQTSVNITNSVAFDDADYYLLEVDQGSTPTSVDVGVSISTTNSAGLQLWLGDLDGYAQLAGTYENSDWVTGAGTVAFTLTLPARSGVHEVVLSVVTDDVGTSSYNGTVSVTAGTIVQTDAITVSQLFEGTRIFFDRVVQFQRDYNGSGKLGAEVDIDFGGTAHTTTFSVQAFASEVSLFELTDATGAPTVVYSGAADSFDFVDETFTYTTASYSGVATYRIEITRNGPSGSGLMVIVLGPDVTAVGVTELGNPGNPGGNGNGDGNGSDGGCSTSGTPSHWA